MENFKKSVLSEYLNVTLQWFRDSIVCNYDVNHIGDAYYLSVICGYCVPEILITAISRLGFTFHSVCITSVNDNRLKLLFYIDDKDI